LARKKKKKVLFLHHVARPPNYGATLLSPCAQYLSEAESISGKGKQREKAISQGFVFLHVCPPPLG